jgi:hypothetical protein
MEPERIPKQLMDYKPLEEQDPWDARSYAGKFGLSYRGAQRIERTRTLMLIIICSFHTSQTLFNAL